MTKPSLNDEQVAALETARQCLMTAHWEVAEALENAFPEAFDPEPEWAEDQVVMTRFRGHSGNGWMVATRTEDGEWTIRGHEPGLPTDKLVEFYEVYRLSPEAQAELLTIVRGGQA